MGIYIDKGNGAFRRIRNSEYIDKSGLIAVINYRADEAIAQIRERRYQDKVAEYTGFLFRGKEHHRVEK